MKKPASLVAANPLLADALAQLLRVFFRVGVTAGGSGSARVEQSGIRSERPTLWVPEREAVGGVQGYECCRRLENHQMVFQDWLFAGRTGIVPSNAPEQRVTRDDCAEARRTA
jgi:hypothetical protein